MSHVHRHAGTPKGRASNAHVTKAGQPPAAATTGIGDNDTSVIRGPAIKKAGRVIPYASDSANRRLMIPIGLKKSALGVFGTNREKNVYKGTGSESGSPVPFYIKRRRNNNVLQ